MFLLVRTSIERNLEGKSEDAHHRGPLGQGFSPFSCQPNKIHAMDWTQAGSCLRTYTEMDMLSFLSHSGYA